jgi:hypothetical protein
LPLQVPHRRYIELADPPKLQDFSTVVDSMVDDQPEEPSDTKLELPPPRKLKLFDAGWKSDDTKAFDTDRGRSIVTKSVPGLARYQFRTI